MIMFRKRHPPVGSRPGTLAINGDATQTVIHLMRYDPAGMDESPVEDVGELRQQLAEDKVNWIDVQGLGDEAVLRKIAEIFELHPLALEDVVNVPQRPKVEEYDKHLLLITRMAKLTEDDLLDIEQVGIFVGPNFVLTFQERYGDILDPVRQRLRRGRGAMRRSGSGYLAYAILDTIIDGYYPILESFGERLETLEDEIVEDPTHDMLRRVHRTKRDLLAVRRGIWPQREAVNTLLRDGHELFTDEVRVYLRDCYDHCVQIVDVVETYRELAGGLMDVYLSSVGNKTNDVMRVLTVMASIFIPLTFLAGIYGMNFENMPELHVRWSYPVLLAVMVAIAAGMLAYFYRKGWLGGGSRGDDDDA